MNGLLSVRDRITDASRGGVAGLIAVVTLLGFLFSLPAPFPVSVVILLVGTLTAWRVWMSPVYMQDPPEFPDEHTAPFVEADNPEVDLWQPLPVGVLRDGRIASVPLWDVCGLVAGQPGSGKSAFMRTVAGAVALYPYAKLAIADGMAGPDFVALAKCSVYADLVSDPEELEGYLDTLLVEIPRRARRLAELDLDKLDKATCESEMPLWITFVDEWQSYSKTLVPDDKLGKRIEAKLSKIVSLGRKVGVLVIGATQYPTKDAIHSSIKQKMALRVAFRLADKTATNVVLGSGTPIDAATIPFDRPGVAYLQIGARLRKLRSFKTEREDLTRIAEIAYQRKLATGCLLPAEPVGSNTPQGASTVRLDNEPDIVDTIMAVMDETGRPDKIWSEALIPALAKHDPQYRSLTPQMLGKLIRDAGYTESAKNALKTRLVTIDNSKAKGFYRAQLEQARERKRNKGNLSREELERQRWQELPDSTKRFVRQIVAGIRAGDQPCVYHDGAHPGPTVDHVTPIMAGGTWHPSNLAASCAHANSRKADMPVDDFIAAERERWSTSS